VAQLVGEVQDEFDAAEPEPALVTPTSMVLDGSTSIRDLEAEYEIALPRDGGFETLAGFVLARMQKIPRPGEAIDFEAHRFTVVEMDGHRIAKIKVEVAKQTAMQQAGD